MLCFSRRRLIPSHITSPHDTMGVSVRWMIDLHPTLHSTLHSTTQQYVPSSLRAVRHRLSRRCQPLPVSLSSLFPFSVSVQLSIVSAHESNGKIKR